MNRLFKNIGNFVEIASTIVTCILVAGLILELIGILNTSHILGNTLQLIDDILSGGIVGAYAMLVVSNFFVISPVRTLFILFTSGGINLLFFERLAFRDRYFVFFNKIVYMYAPLALFVYFFFY
tara:strand:+ start:210 stop:581 length:372 start_codon:yes stop_codon:yes gene_type:complete